jgi:ketosteroid isomerase-like protein
MDAAVGLVQAYLRLNGYFPDRAIVRSTAWLAGLLISLSTGSVIAEPVSADSAAITTAVENFHRALIQGDCAAALAALSEDALILESGSSQTRTEYERGHLAEDIAFASATKTERSPLIVRQEGNVAWTIATSKTTGTFQGRKVDSAGVELMVLTKTESGWRIRAIHWSNREAKKK